MAAILTCAEKAVQVEKSSWPAGPPRIERTWKRRPEKAAYASYLKSRLKSRERGVTCQQSMQASLYVARLLCIWLWHDVPIPPVHPECRPGTWRRQGAQGGWYM